jgi:exodeoxyribonuclease VII small subunit
MTSSREPPTTDERPPARPSFEEASARLARIVDELERGDLPLEKALALFEEGVGLARAAEERILAAEKRVEELLAVDPSGKPVVRTLPIGGDEP